MKNLLLIALVICFVATGLCVKVAIADEKTVVQETGIAVKGISDESFFSRNEYQGILGFSASKSKFLFESNEYTSQILKEANNSDFKQEKSEFLYSPQGRGFYKIFEETKQILSKIVR